MQEKKINWLKGGIEKNNIVSNISKTKKKKKKKKEKKNLALKI